MLSAQQDLDSRGTGPLPENQRPLSRFSCFQYTLRYRNAERACLSDMESANAHAPQGRCVSYFLDGRAVSFLPTFPLCKDPSTGVLIIFVSAPASPALFAWSTSFSSLAPMIIPTPKPRLPCGREHNLLGPSPHSLFRLSHPQREISFPINLLADRTRSLAASRKSPAVSFAAASSSSRVSIITSAPASLMAQRREPLLQLLHLPLGTDYVRTARAGR